MMSRLPISVSRIFNARAVDAELEGTRGLVGGSAAGLTIRISPEGAMEPHSYAYVQHRRACEARPVK